MKYIKYCDVCKNILLSNNRIYCICDAFTCSIICRKKYLSQISSYDPSFSKPQYWKIYEKLNKSTSSFSLNKLENNDVIININCYVVNTNSSNTLNKIHENLYIVYIYENIYYLYYIYIKILKLFYTSGNKIL